MIPICILPLILCIDFWHLTAFKGGGQPLRVLGSHERYVGYESVAEKNWLPNVRTTMNMIRICVRVGVLLWYTAP